MPPGLPTPGSGSPPGLDATLPDQQALENKIHFWDLRYFTILTFFIAKSHYYGLWSNLSVEIEFTYCFEIASCVHARSLYRP